MLPENREKLTLSLDGKTIRSTGKMECYESPLHIVSAQVADLGITFAQQTVEGKSNEWHYYISSRELTAEELLCHARMEWSVETMHWLLDVHFSEDQCRIEDKNIQQNLNMVRKLAINLIKSRKERTASKQAISKIMFDCLLDPSCICGII